MKVAELIGIREMKISERDKPTIKNNNDVLLKVSMVGICGSDVHYYTTGKIGSQVVEYPFIVGHEFAAYVEDTGSNVSNVKKGDLVAIDPAMPCFDCDQCKAGREHTCRNLNFLGCPKQAEGSLCEYLIMPAHCCVEVNNLSEEEAVLSEPLSIGLYACKLAGNLNGAKIGIMGCGPIGISVMLAAKAFGAENIYMSDPIKERREIAANNGADFVFNPNTENVSSAIEEKEPLLLDYVFECAGEQSTFDTACELLAPGSKLMLIGIPEFDRYSFAADIARRKELCIQHVRRQNGCLKETLKMLEKKKIDAGFMVSHYFNFEETQKGFDLVDSYSDGVMKAMIRI
jgi:L-iditol 2-dehydrogenase